MRSNQLHEVSASSWTELGSSASIRHWPPFDPEMIERGAQALFEFVFSGTERLDGKHLWANCDDQIKAGFRAEARAVLKAAWPGLADITALFS